MRMPKPKLSALLLLLSSLAFAQEGPGLGVPASPEEIAGWDISISPDGENLPAGSGTAAQGESVYVIECLVCHGPNGEGAIEPRLVGGHGTIDTANAVKTVGSYWPYATTVFDYIRRSMPFQLPGSLTDNEVYALTAYLLELNGIIDENLVLNADTLSAVEMPNRDGFVWAWEED
ncbi:MAG: c-type cytochrome [Pseudohongiellaceae bacterium]